MDAQWEEKSKKNVKAENCHDFPVSADEGFEKGAVERTIGLTRSWTAALEGKRKRKRGEVG